jgi:hypothetical protein
MTFVTEPSGGLCGGAGLPKGVGGSSVRAQPAAKAEELSRDAPAALRKSLRVSFRLPTCVLRFYPPLRQGSMAAYDPACRVVRRGTFLLIVFLLAEAGGVVSLPMRLSAVLPPLLLSRFVLTAAMLLIAISALSAATTR